MVGVKFLRADEQVMLITEKGMIIRLNTADISTIGRNTQGVRLIQLEEGDHLVSVARLAERETTTRSPADPAGLGVQGGAMRERRATLALALGLTVAASRAAAASRRWSTSTSTRSKPTTRTR